LMSQVYLRLEDWARLLELLPELRRQNALREDELQALERRVHAALLAQAGQRLAAADSDPASLVIAAWERMPTRLREDPELIEAYALQLRGHSREEMAEQVLRAALLQQFDERLANLYGLVRGKDCARQLANAEQWLLKHPHNATLLLAAGRLAQRNSLWGKARDYLEASFASRRDIQTCAELARLLDRMGDSAGAQRTIRDGFEMLEDHLPTLPLPDA